MLKIFLAEDEVVVRETIKRMIPWEELGFELVGEAADGEMALPLLIRQQPDLLITDIKMPFMDRSNAGTSGQKGNTGAEGCDLKWI